MVEIAEGAVLRLGSGGAGAAGVKALNCSDHDVSGRVFEAGEFNHVHVVATTFELEAAQAVCQVFCQAVF